MEKKEPMQYQCNYCGLPGLQEWQLKSHVKSVHATFHRHPLVYSFIWICSKCDFYCTSSPQLKKHVKETHTLAKTFQCKYCELTFPKIQIRKRHIESVHEKKKNFICEFANCGLGYSHRDSLKRHVQSIHEDKKPFECHLCDYSFSFKWNFERHLCLVHKKSTAVAKTLASLAEKAKKAENSQNSAKPKGQIISEGHFGVLNFPKKQRIISMISALASKMGQIKK